MLLRGNKGFGVNPCAAASNQEREVRRKIHQRKSAAVDGNPVVLGVQLRTLPQSFPKEMERRSACSTTLEIEDA